MRRRLRRKGLAFFGVVVESRDVVFSRNSADVEVRVSRVSGLRATAWIMVLKRSLVLGLLLFGLASESRAQSSIEAIFPKGFDPKHKYTAYTYDDLDDHVKMSFHVTNAFVGEKVKVVALYDAGSGVTSLSTNPFNPSKALFKRYGCNTDFCGRLEVMLGERALLRMVQLHPVLLYFRGPREYSTFVVSSKDICKTINPCYLLAAGTLRMTTIQVRTAVGTFDRDAIYLEPDRVSLFKTSQAIGGKLIFKAGLNGAELGAQLFSWFPH